MKVNSVFELVMFVSRLIGNIVVNSEIVMLVIRVSMCGVLKCGCRWVSLFGSKLLCDMVKKMWVWL